MHSFILIIFFLHFVFCILQIINGNALAQFSTYIWVWICMKYYRIWGQSFRGRKNWQWYFDNKSVCMIITQHWFIIHCVNMIKIYIDKSSSLMIMEELSYPSQMLKHYQHFNLYCGNYNNRKKYEFNNRPYLAHGIWRYKRTKWVNWR